MHTGTPLGHAVPGSYAYAKGFIFGEGLYHIMDIHSDQKKTRWTNIIIKSYSWSYIEFRR